jgi:electron transfer flavoprotein beta subunit
MKAVPSTTEVRMDPVTHTIVRDGRQAVVNPFDASGLEVALEIRERLGGHVSALSMGIPDTVRLLRDAISRGADDGLLLSDRAFAGADTLATSYALSRAIARGGMPDLVVCGKMAVDGDTAQIGPELAGALGMSCVTDVREIEHVDEGHITARRRRDGALELVEAALPCVITVAKDAATPRMPSIAGVRRGEAGTVEVLDAEAAGCDPARCGLDGSPTQVVRSFVPERSATAERVEGTSAEQAERIEQIVEGMAL